MINFEFNSNKMRLYCCTCLSDYKFHSNKKYRTWNNEFFQKNNINDKCHCIFQCLFDYYCLLLFKPFVEVSYYYFYLLLLLLSFIFFNTLSFFPTNQYVSIVPLPCKI